MALKRLLGAALVISVLGFTGCQQPTKTDPAASPSAVTTSAPAEETPEASESAETPEAVATETPTEAAETPAAGDSPVASSGGDGDLLADLELAEGMTGYEEVVALAGSVPPSSPEAIAKGKELYSQNCALCHGESGVGDGPGGASLDPPPRDLTVASEYKYGHLELALYRTATYGIEGTGMAPWDGIISPEDQWAIGHYIRTIQK